MIRRYLAGLVFAIFSLGATAASVLMSGQFATDTVAIANGTADANSSGGPASAGPFISSAGAVGTTDFASAGSIAGLGLLNTSAAADSVSGIASAVASAKYVAEFTGFGGLLLHFDFLTSDFNDPGEFSLGSLILRVTSAGLTVLEEVFTSGSTFDRQISVLGSPDQMVELVLSSEADAFKAGSAFNSAQVSFDIRALPEPATLLLVAGTLFAIVTRRRTHTSPRA